MTPHTYAPGDLVKIISMEEVRKWPETDEGYSIGNIRWRPKMNGFAGTEQTIELAHEQYYGMKNLPWCFSPEMIAGPAEPPNEYTDMVTKIRKKTDEVIAAGPAACKKYLAELWGMESEEDTGKYAERLERFVLAVAGGGGADRISDIITDAKSLLAAFDEEVKKYKV